MTVCLLRCHKRLQALEERELSLNCRIGTTSSAQEEQLVRQHWVEAGGPHNREANWLPQHDTGAMSSPQKRSNAVTPFPHDAALSRPDALFVSEEEDGSSMAP